MKNVNNSSVLSEVEISYRKQYGKLFSALLFQFGSSHIERIEDAIQNAFYKSLKSWKPNKVPKSKENWLFVVAKNDLLNQIGKDAKTVSLDLNLETLDEENSQEDLRLKTILLFASSTNISTQTKVIFILKNIFGLHIKEISESTLIHSDAIYKSINRAKKSFNPNEFERLAKQKTVDKTCINIVEEILYAVFNVGFDSFNEKNDSTVNDDICLEALALAKVLFQEYKTVSTSNLIALFCFHIARISTKETNKKIVPFHEQKTNNWNTKLINLGFQYMEKPQKLNRYYIEAIITSKHMTTKTFNLVYWNQITELYKLLLKITDSPIVKINLCYCLHQAERTDEAIELLEQIEKELPENHLYFSLVKADILKKKNIIESSAVIDRLLNNVSQEIRKNYIVENIMPNL